jgi:hypothetical protein
MRETVDVDDVCKRSQTDHVLLLTNIISLGSYPAQRE